MSSAYRCQSSSSCVEKCRVLEEFDRVVTSHMHKRSRCRVGVLTEIRKVKVDAGLIRHFNRDIEDLHRQFMEALSSFTAFRIQAIERKVGRILTDGTLLFCTKISLTASRRRVCYTPAANGSICCIFSPQYLSARNTPGCSSDNLELGGGRHVG